MPDEKMNAKEFEHIFTTNILPFWVNRMVDTEYGGFYGRVDGDGILHPKANKGLVLNARILWTFSRAYRILKDDKYLQLASRAFKYLTANFIDKTHGGVYWEVDYRGCPANTKKQLYAQAFALYAFSEYYRATASPEALRLSKIYFELIEKTADKQYGGYFEAFAADWSPITDVRLSEKDANEKKSMNTHLHILEAYTNLYHIWKIPAVANAQRELINLFGTRIIDKKTWHSNLFFTDDWMIRSNARSYGHDIEASWLLWEAAHLLNDPKLLRRTTIISTNMVESVTEGLQPDGSLAYERDGFHLDNTRQWWVQAEAVVGFSYAHRYSRNTTFNRHATNAWNYIQSQLIDHVHGEWYWSRDAGGSIDIAQDKAGPWKCPYHNGRMCLEMITILSEHQ